MKINIKTNQYDGRFEIAKKYLPVRLSTTTFVDYGECVVIVANRVEGVSFDFVENANSEVFITLMNKRIYDNIKARVLGMDYWIPQELYSTFDGFADGIPRKIHLDESVFYF